MDNYLVQYLIDDNNNEVILTKILANKDFFNAM